MNYSILLFFCVLTVYFILKNKNPLVIEIVYFIISPCVKLGSLNIDSTYLFVLFVIIVLLIKKKGKFKAESFNGFFHLMVFWIIFYLLGWIINGQMINLSGVIISVLGLINIPLKLYNLSMKSLTIELALSLIKFSLICKLLLYIKHFLVLS